jgi:hypothetical protein
VSEDKVYAVKTFTLKVSASLLLSLTYPITPVLKSFAEGGLGESRFFKSGFPQGVK